MIMAWGEGKDVKRPYNSPSSFAHVFVVYDESYVIKQLVVDSGKRLICNLRWTIDGPHASASPISIESRESCLLLLLAGRCSRTLYVEKDWEAISSWWGKSSNFSGECDWILPLPNIRLPNPWSYLLHKHQPDVSSLTWLQVWVPNKPMNLVPYVCIYLYSNIIAWCL